jgi:transcription-repair coupling factor (superfamily II helicase)
MNRDISGNGREVLEVGRVVPGDGRDVLEVGREILCAPLSRLGEFAAAAADLENRRGPISVHELGETQKAHFACALESATGQPVLMIAHNEYAAQKAYDDLRALYGQAALFFPAREIMLYDVEAKNYEIVFRRVRALDRLLRGDFRAAVMSVEAAAQFVPPPELFAEMTLELSVGGSLDMLAVGQRLVNMGYERVTTVEARGAFAIRGGILDVYPIDQEYAVRIELFDIEIDSIRLFDTETQRSIESAERVKILPARDILYRESDLPDIVARLETALETPNGAEVGSVSGAETGAALTVAADIEKFQTARYFAGIDRYLSFLCEDGATPLSYVGATGADPREAAEAARGTKAAPRPASALCTFLLDEPVRAFQKLESLSEEHENICAALIERGKLLPSARRVRLDFHELAQRIPAERRLATGSLHTSREAELLGPARKTYAITGKSAVSYQGNVELLKTDIRDRLRDRWTVILLTKSEIKGERLFDALNAENIPVRRCGGTVSPSSVSPAASAAHDAARHSAASPALPGFINIVSGNLANGFEYPKIKLLVICDTEFQSGARSAARRAKKPQPGAKIEYFTDLRVGDFVVHQSHGIGVFAGLEQLTAVDGAKRDFLKLRYKDGDFLYIPTNQLDLVQKYIGADAHAPRVNSLNGTEWAKAKKRVKESLKTLAAELILIYAKRREARGYAFSKDTVWQRQFEEQFPYTETDDQLRSIEEIKADMESARLMDRLLCGDVGFGKTEVAIRAVFKAVTDGKQAAFLVPTTVLAQQHYQTFLDRFRDFPISVDVLSRFRTAKEQRRITDALRAGKLDVIVGTHKLLNKSIGFKNLGLLVVDEEQRFGVNQKERIKVLKPDVDVLSLSATPIPRTLHMSMTKIRDISVLKDPPEERFPVQTFVMEYDEDVVREAILREVAREGQVFYLYNRVMGIDIKTMQLRSLLPEGVRIAFAHGQMADRELEDIMLAFVNRQYDVLVCTTIIESGLDMPNVNTIVVEDADRMGLAQLYQLRGRVGRSNRLAYAYITHRRDKIITEESEKRLQAIREFTELGSGFKIAMRDMEIRGIGNLLGVEQHGHMESVGYDMYCRLLDEAVRELEREGRANAAAATGASAAGVGGAVDGQVVSQPVGSPNDADAADGPTADEVGPVSLDIGVSAYIDGLYIEDESQRLEMYQKIAAVRSAEDAQDVTDEMIDRFSELPAEAENLIKLARIKVLAARCGIASVAEKNGHITMALAKNGKFSAERLSAVSQKYRRQVLFSAGVNPYIVYKPAAQAAPTAPAHIASAAAARLTPFSHITQTAPSHTTAAAARTAAALTASASAHTSAPARTMPTGVQPFAPSAAVHAAPSAAAHAAHGDILDTILRFLQDF